jgi:tetratricopeptide (TPR) repeat protein
MLDIAKRYAAASGSAEASALVGEAYGFLGQYDEALRATASTLELFPTQYALVETRAQLFRAMNDFTSGGTELKKLIAADRPKEAWMTGYGGLRSDAVYFGRYREAVRICDEWEQRSLGAKDTVAAITSIIARANVYGSMRQDTALVRKELNRLVALQADTGPETRMGIAFIWAFLGNVPAADSLSRGVDGWHQAANAFAYMARHDFAQARVYLDSAFSFGAPSGARAGAFYTLARHQFAAGQADSALVTMERMWALHPPTSREDHPSALGLMGKICEATGDRKRAAESYERALACWKTAESDYPLFAEVKTRFAKLKGIASK